MANTISFDVNNQRKMKLIQRQHDGVTLIMVENAGGGSECNIPDNEAFISAGDFVMLVNYYRFVKRHDIQNDFINPTGKRKDPSTWR